MARVKAMARKNSGRQALNTGLALLSGGVRLSTVDAALSLSDIKILLLVEAESEIYGSVVVEKTSLTSGSVYPNLHQMEERGVLSSRFEHRTAPEPFAPARRWYKLTDRGRLLLKIWRSFAEELYAQLEG